MLCYFPGCQRPADHTHITKGASCKRHSQGYHDPLIKPFLIWLTGMGLLAVLGGIGAVLSFSHLAGR
jgi:hypothetical protein